MARRFHIGLSVRGALMNWKKRQFENMLKNDDGSTMTADAARAYLLDELAKGHEVIPMGTCDNWDWKDGCQGHEVAG